MPPPPAGIGLKTKSTAMLMVRETMKIKKVIKLRVFNNTGAGNVFICCQIFFTETIDSNKTVSFFYVHELSHCYINKKKEIGPWNVIIDQIYLVSGILEELLEYDLRFIIFIVLSLNIFKGLQGYRTLIQQFGYGPRKSSY